MVELKGVALYRSQWKEVFFCAYLICDGGYHTWPCRMSPSKNRMPNSPEMRWSKNVELVRKDIEDVFGILKVRFRLLKNFNYLRKQSSIDDVDSGIKVLEVWEC